MAAARRFRSGDIQSPPARNAAAATAKHEFGRARPGRPGRRKALARVHVAFLRAIFAVAATTPAACTIAAAVTLLAMPAITVRHRRIVVVAARTTLAAACGKGRCDDQSNAGQELSEHHLRPLLREELVAPPRASSFAAARARYSYPHHRPTTAASMSESTTIAQRLPSAGAASIKPRPLVAECALCHKKSQPFHRRRAVSATSGRGFMAAPRVSAGRPASRR